MGMLSMCLVLGIFGTTFSSAASDSFRQRTGITKTSDGSFVCMLHNNPDIYLGWKVEQDGTIWLTLNCPSLGASKYCAFGITRPGLPANQTKNMLNSDIYTAHGDVVDDRYGDSATKKPAKDVRSDIICDHCGVHDDGEIHSTFYRNLTSDDPQDVDITNTTYRIVWAIGPLGGGDISYHTIRPNPDQYRYINFLFPEMTVVPATVTKQKGDAGAVATLGIAALAAAVLANGIA